MASEQAEVAWNEARQFLDRLKAAGTEASASSGLEDAFARLSPEARMLAAERLAGPSPSAEPAERNRYLVSQLMRGGHVTLNELHDDLASMSREGRAHAFGLLTSHPDYRVKGIRWQPGPHSPALVGQYTAYQILVDNVRALIDDKRAEAMSLIHKSKTTAGQGDWAGAVRTIRRAVTILEDLVDNVSDEYSSDLAVALYHLEAYLGSTGDRRGAQDAITRSLDLFTRCVKAGDDALRFDVANALRSQAICFAEQGDLSGALLAESGAVTVLEELAETDWREYGPALAEHLAELANFHFLAGDLANASSAISRAVDMYDSLVASHVAVHQDFVILARRRQSEIRSATKVGVPAQQPRAFKSAESSDPGIPESVKSRVEVIGSTQEGFVNKPTVKVYWNGEEVGAVQHGGRFAFEIASDGEVRFKYAFRSVKLRVKPGGVNKIQLSWDRTWGRLVAQVVDSAAVER
jgi:hypothetical protein